MENKNKEIYETALKKHEAWHGKLEMVSRVDLSTKDELSYAYTPGVAQPCLEIQKDIDLSYKYTRRWNTVAVITDGTAILGLGDIGPEAGMPVMEGKSVLFKTFGDVDAIPLCIKSKDTEELIRTIYLLSGSFGGINLEDISAPRCFEIETRLKEICDIPIFHDDQHGTAIIATAAIINALKLVKKEIKDCKCVISGAGAAGISIGKLLMKLGLKDVIFTSSKGVIYEGKEGINPAQAEIAKVSNRSMIKGELKDAMVGADIFIGVSKPNLVTKEMIKSMAKDPIVFPLANPVPEISYEDAKEAGARVVGTGSSRYPNQINNVLIFPGLFRGLLDARCKVIDDDMMLLAARAIASCVPDDEITEDKVIPFAYDRSAHKKVADAVKEYAYERGIARAPRE